MTTLAPIPPAAAQNTNGPAKFNGINSVTADLAGNLYLTESSHTVRRLTPVGTSWVLTTLAGLAGHPGTADGPGDQARFNHPESLAVGTAGNIYVGDWGDYTIRKVTLEGTNWVVRTLAGRPGVPGSKDGIGSASRLRGPCVAVDSAGFIFEADFTDNWVIRRGLPALAINSWRASLGFHKGAFEFDLAGPVGEPVVVEASSDLNHWTAVTTNMLAGPLAAPSTFSDPEQKQKTRRFYRLKSR